MNKNWLFVVLLGALTLTGCCGHDDETYELTKADFTASIAQQNVSRAYDASWQAGDVIGISGVSGEVVYSNVAYVTAAGNGTFAPVNADNAITYMTDGRVNFTAYYPWQEGATSVIEFSTADQSRQSSFDYLYGTGSGVYTSPTVNIAFKHTMSKVVFTLKAGSDLSYEQLKAATMSMSGLVLQGSFNVATGETKVNSQRTAGEIVLGSDSPRTEDSDASTVSYSVIVFPQQLGQAVDLTFTSEGTTFTTTLTLPDENTLRDGTEYDVTVTLNKTSATVNGCTIADWEKKTLDDIVAE
jgi:hypothetical protein